MAFKKAVPVASVPDSPEKLFLDFPRRKIPDVLPHQGEIMRSYASNAVDDEDVALQLPTGSGKTLVGLLMAEWRRRKNNERIVFLCPTRQLVNQVVEQAEEKYGLTVLGFTGSARNYIPEQKARYRNADNIAVTTYSSLFNTNPFFDDADVLIFDDAHVAENYVASLWNVSVDRNNLAHQSLYTALKGVLKPIIDPMDFSRISGSGDHLSDAGSWVDKIPTPEFIRVHDEIVEVLDVYAEEAGLGYTWPQIRANLNACQLYISSQEILIRPIIPPTWTHKAFVDPKQRIYMSATLGEGGDLERLMGRHRITRLQVPDGWNRHGVGRRFFIFPGMSLQESEAVKLRDKLMLSAGRSLVLAPSEKMHDAICKNVSETLGFTVYSAKDIEESKKPFTSDDTAVAVVANRYDGIDFPGDECRLLFVEGLPKAMNIQERFLMSRMGALVLFNERIQTRVLQAIGRCTRSLEDYSAVVVSGEELPGYLADIKRRKYLYPELQAEIQFGVEQSKGASLDDISENFDVFLENGRDWEEVNQQIVSYRKDAKRNEFPALDDLSKAVRHEIDFQMRLWQGDFEAALECAEKVLSELKSPDLQGYRALWHYLAGSAAWLGANDGVPRLDVKSRMQFGLAKNAAKSVPWLVKLARYQTSENDDEQENRAVVMRQVERLEEILFKLGTIHDRKFASREKEILEGLRNEKYFEYAHKLLGEVLGFDSGKVESNGSPDPWWIADDICFVFEDHAGAEATSSLSVNKARQVASHPKWIKENVEGYSGDRILSILISPVNRADNDALPHLTDVSFWPLESFISWAESVLAIIRELRKTFVEPGDLAWRAEAAKILEDNRIDANSLYQDLNKCKASVALKMAV